jgi:hypothetical protein
MADKVSSDKRKKKKGGDLESENGAVRLKHTVTGGSCYKLILHSRRKRQQKLTVDSSTVKNLAVRT